MAKIKTVGAWVLEVTGWRRFVRTIIAFPVIAFYALVLFVLAVLFLPLLAIVWIGHTAAIAERRLYRSEWTP